MCFWHLLMATNFRVICLWAHAHVLTDNHKSSSSFLIVVSLCHHLNIPYRHTYESHTSVQCSSAPFPERLLFCSSTSETCQECPYVWWWFSACVDLWMCSSVYMHVCVCVLGDKSQMWLMDSPGVSMMRRRRRPPRSRWKVGPISHNTGLCVNPASQPSHLPLRQMLL